jgi:hypothetical protein
MIRIPTHKEFLAWKKGYQVPTVRLPFDRWDVCTAAGGLLVALGAAMIYRPAGVILGGLELVVTGLIGAAHPAKGGDA